MSVKAQGLVWDLKCPDKYGEIEFKPSHKYILVAYADHADHNGKNIFPSVRTIEKKTGIDERTIQRHVRTLEQIGLLIPDGMGINGTNRYKLPYSQGGDKLTPVKMTPVDGGDKKDNPLGDIPSGDIPSGDKLTPELKEFNQANLIKLSNDFFNVWEETKKEIQTKAVLKRAQFQTWVHPTEAASFDGRTLYVWANNAIHQEWLRDNVTDAAQNIIGCYVKFIVPESSEEDTGE